MQTTRRGFIGSLIKLSVGFTILPSAVTYARQWKRPIDGALIILPNYDLSHKYLWITSMEAYNAMRIGPPPKISLDDFNDEFLRGVRFSPKAMSAG